MRNPRLIKITRMRWTKSSIDCYLLGCQCNKCSVYQILGKRCKMKYTVLELVRRFGIPIRKEEGELYETTDESEETGETES